jgi:hypothetical protein
MLIFYGQSVRTSCKLRQIDAQIFARRQTIRKERPTMTSNSYRTTAKIYQFPAGGRASRPVDAHLGLPKTNLPASDTGACAAKIVYGGGWYHDEAIQDAA